MKVTTVKNENGITIIISPEDKADEENLNLLAKQDSEINLLNNAVIVFHQSLSGVILSKKGTGGFATSQIDKKEEK